MNIERKDRTDKKYLRSDSKNGQASIEFILILPFMLIIFIIFFQLGYCVYLKNTIEQSAREAARIIATTNSNDKAARLIRSNLDGKNLVLKNLFFLPEDENQRDVGGYIKVKIKAEYKGLADILTNFFLKNFTGEEGLIEAESIMRMECGGYHDPEKL
jgi:uncharacterized protein (UPF0333 family)